MCRHSSASTTQWTWWRRSTGGCGRAASQAPSCTASTATRSRCVFCPHFQEAAWSTITSGHCGLLPGTALHTLYWEKVQVRRLLLHCQYERFFCDLGHRLRVASPALRCTDIPLSERLLQQSNQLPALVHGPQAALMHQTAAQAAAQAAGPVCFDATPVPTLEKTADCMSAANARCCACRISPRRSCSWT